MVLIEILNKGKFGVKEFFTNFDLKGGLGMQFLALLRWIDENGSDDVINANLSRIAASRFTQYNWRQ